MGEAKRKARALARQAAARTWTKGANPLDPRNAIKMSTGELFLLAGTPLPSDQPFAARPVYVPRIPVDMAEAQAMLRMSTITVDATDPNCRQRVYAGYTLDELRGGKPAVIVRGDSK